MMADDGEQLELATEMTIAWLSNPHTRAQAEDVSAMLGSMLTALRGLSASSATVPEESPAAAEYTRAVTVRRSLSAPDRIISMIDGKPYGSLKRHLRSHSLTPDEYRQRYGLKPDYPMVAPGYSATRAALAKQHGFGRKAGAEADRQVADEAAPEPATVAAPEPQVEAAPTRVSAKRRRLGISGAKQAAQAHLGSSDGETSSEPEAQ